MSEGKQKVAKVCKVAEAVFLATTVLVITGLFTVPTIIYASLPSNGVESGLQNTTDICLQTAPYSGEICRDTLTSKHMCLSDTTELRIPTSKDQQIMENKVQQILAAVPLLNPSPECAEKIKPFLCLHLFGLCDSSGSLHTVGREDCLELRDVVCSREWEKTVQTLGAEVVPICEELTNVTDDCFGLMDSSFNNTTPDCIELEGFYFDEEVTRQCRPICGEFLSRNVVQKRAMVTIGLVSSVLTFILMFLQRDTLLVFPSIILVYMNAGAFIILLLVDMALFNIDLICGSKDFLLAFAEGNETIFCFISGLVFSYLIFQLTLFLLFHTIILFWAITSPFTFRTLKLSGHMRYIHIASIVLAFLLPLVPSLVPVKDGYIPAGFPAYICWSRNLDLLYYFQILPFSVISTVVSSLQLLLVWIILKKWLSKKVARSSDISILTAAQIKASLAFTYFTLITVVTLVAVTLYELDGKQIAENIADFIICSSDGNCTMPPPSNSSSSRATDTVVVMMACFPLVMLLLSINRQTLKKIATKRKNLRKPDKTINTANTIL